MGAGPLERGSIYGETTFAGITVKPPAFLESHKKHKTPHKVTIADAHQFVHPAVLEQQIADAAAAKEQNQPNAVVPASHDLESKDK